MGSISLVHSGNVKVMSAALARSFYDDPVASWLFPSLATREHDLKVFFDTQLRHGYIPRGEVVATSDYMSVAMWMSSWTSSLNLLDRLAHLRIPLLMRSHFSAAHELTRILADKHPRVPHLYLGTIATVPDYRNRGYASACMRALLTQSDAEGVGTYLECSNEQNIAFYQHHGFEVVETVVAPEGGPTLWLMWKDAQLLS